MPPDVSASDASAQALDPDRFADALLQALSRKGMSQRELAEHLGIRQQSVSGWINGRARPSTENLQETLDHLGIDWETVRRRALPLPTRSDARETTVAVYTDVRASGGPGFLVGDVDGDEARRLSTPKEILAALIGVWPSDVLGGIYVVGDSMVDPSAVSGGLPDGQLVLFEPADSVLSGHRHVVSVDSDAWGPRVLVKRLHIGLDGSLAVASDNPLAEVPAERLLPDAMGGMTHAETGRPVDLAVVGRVVWPRESDDERTVKSVTRAIERLVETGVLR